MILNSDFKNLAGVRKASTSIIIPAASDIRSGLSKTCLSLRLRQSDYSFSRLQIQQVHVIIDLLSPSERYQTLEFRNQHSQPATLSHPHRHKVDKIIHPEFPLSLFARSV